MDWHLLPYVSRLPGERPKTQQTLLLGAVDADPQGIYAMRESSESVVLLPQTFWHDLPKTPNRLRDQTLLRFDRERVVSLELESPHEQIKILRTGKRQFQLVQPHDEAADKRRGLSAAVGAQPFQSLHGCVGCQCRTSSLWVGTTSLAD